MVYPCSAHVALPCPQEAMVIKMVKYALIKQQCIVGPLNLLMTTDKGLQIYQEQKRYAKV